MITQFLVVNRGVQQQLNKVPKFDFNKSMDSIQPAFHIGYRMTSQTLQFLSHTIHLFDIMFIILILLGTVIVLVSSFGGNAKWRKAGYATAITFYVMFIVAHILLVGGLAHQEFIGNWLSVVIMIAGQITLYVIPTALFVNGATYMDLYNVLEDPNELDKAKLSFRYMFISALFAGLFYLVAGVLK